MRVLSPTLAGVYLAKASLAKLSALVHKFTSRLECWLDWERSDWGIEFRKMKKRAQDVPSIEASSVEVTVVRRETTVCGGAVCRATRMAARAELAM